MSERKWAALLISLTAAALGILCAGRKGEKEQMLEYMEKKYGEPFTAMEAYGGQLGKDYTMMKVRSGRRNISGILVRAVREQGKVVYQDNYISYLLRDSLEQRILALAVPVFGECRVFYKIPEMVFSEEFPADMDADAFLRHPSSMIRMYFYIKDAPSDEEKQLERLLSALKKKGYVLGGVVSYPADEKCYEMINRENFTGDIYMGYRYRREVIFSMDEKGDTAYLEWKEGVRKDRR